MSGTFEYPAEVIYAREAARVAREQEIQVACDALDEVLTAAADGSGGYSEETLIDVAADLVGVLRRTPTPWAHDDRPHGQKEGR